MVVTRAQWGARHENGSGSVPEPAPEAYLHHSVTTAPGSSPDAEVRAVRLLESIGEQRFGRGISYNRVVMPSGRIYEGVSWNRRGAHTGGRNTVARSWVLVGNYDIDQVPAAMVEAVARDLAQAWRERHVQQPRLTGGHRDAPGASTSCPGRHGHAAIARINARAAQLRNLPNQEDDMPLAETDRPVIERAVAQVLRSPEFRGEFAALIARAVFSTPGTVPWLPAGEGAAQPAGIVLRDIGHHARLAAASQGVDAGAVASAVVSQLLTSADLVGALVEAVSAEQVEATLAEAARRLATGNP